MLLHWFMGLMTLVLKEGIVLQIFKVHRKKMAIGEEKHMGLWEGENEFMKCQIIQVSFP